MIYTCTLLCIWSKKKPHFDVVAMPSFQGSHQVNKFSEIYLFPTNFVRSTCTMISLKI